MTNYPKVIKVVSVKIMQNTQIVEILSYFNKYGTVIIECEPVENPQENLLGLREVFGNIKQHNHSDKDGIVLVQPMLNHRNYVNTTSQDLALHTDGTFEQDLIKVMALQCEVAASSGGLTKLVDGQDIYKYIQQINPEKLVNLFENDVLIVKRDNQTAAKPIFSYNDDRVQIAFRYDDAVEILVKHEVINVFQKIKIFLEDPKNKVIFKLQPHQIIIVDNTRFLHGRTEFNHAENRLLNRIWFDGNSKYAPHLKFGFIPNNEVHLKCLVTQKSA